MIRFIHCSNVRLDAPLGMTDRKKAAVIRQEMKESFSKMLADAASSSVSLVLITGGLFDRDRISRQTAEFICTELASYPDIRFIIAPGRLDYYSEDSVYAMLGFPENVHVFTSEEITGVSFDIGEDRVTVYGYAATSAEPNASALEGFKVASTECINLLMADHDGTLDGARLALTGADYCALSAPDAEPGVFDEGDTWYSYAASLETLGFDSAEGGYISTEAQKLAGDFTCKAKLVPASHKRYITENVSVSGALSADGVVAKVNEKLSARDDLGSDTVLRLIVKGNVAPDMRDFTEAIKALKVLDKLFITCVIDETVPLYNHEYLSEDPTIKGAFYNALRPAVCSDEKDVSMGAINALRAGLDALDGNKL